MVQEHTQTRKDRGVLIVRSGASRCALPAEDVVRVVRGLTWHPVPGSRLHFLGLAQYGGEPLPVLDLQAMVEGQAFGGRNLTTVIIGRGRERTHSLVGLAVEEVLRVTVMVDPVAQHENGGLVTEGEEIDGEVSKIVNTKRLLGNDVYEMGTIDG
jgi:chemotaxis signal transduction protein